MAMPALSDADIEKKLADLRGWTRDEDMVTKTFTVESYMAGLAFAAAIGTVAEGMNHHPDLFIGWKKVKVSFTTHDAGSKISQKDIDAAAAIDALGYPRR
jgi:4a-hydroxytetrahydrobiopterin dehydratase